MFVLELQKIHQAEIMRWADGERPARRLLLARRAARRGRRSPERAAEGRVSIRDRFARAA
ncbi:hypothetical protein [Streptomyces sp. NPDC059176]|uniref:hypothetical protein n=1 Tax=unclassified Streptomyces TaxID=2593676 RepID=UPI00367A1063